MNPAVVVAGWAAVNAALALLLLAFGENPWFVGLYAVAVVLTLLVVLVVLLARRRPGTPSRLPTGSRSAAHLALAALLVGLGLVHDLWILHYLAGLAVLAALLRFRRERLPAGRAPAPTAVPSRPPARMTAPEGGPWRVVRGVTRFAAVTTLAAKALGSIRGLLGGRR